MEIVYDHNCIRVIDGAVSPEFCQKIIDNFELCHRHHHRRTSSWVNLIEMELWSLTYSGRQLKVALNPLERLGKIKPYNWTEDCDQLRALVFELGKDYSNHWGCENQVRFMPDMDAGNFVMEGMRVKCYRPNQLDEFKLHVDVAHRDSSPRYLSFLFYLNDHDAGTEFPREGYTVEARAGRVVLFPPLWTYPHRGLMPQNDTDKYILSTYLQYT
jgi:hypothetical protein